MSSDHDGVADVMQFVVDQWCREVLCGSRVATAARWSLTLRPCVRGWVMPGTSSGKYTMRDLRGRGRDQPGRHNIVARYGQGDWLGSRVLGLQMQWQQSTNMANSGHNLRSGQPEHCLGFSKAGRRGLSVGSEASGVVPPQG